MERSGGYEGVWYDLRCQGKVTSSYVMLGGLDGKFQKQVLLAKTGKKFGTCGMVKPINVWRTARWWSN